MNVTPIETHLADKVCAMYERHPGKANEESTRLHDLVDIVTIVQTWPISAEVLCEKLRHESGRRHVSLPSAVTSPGPHWDENFAKKAPGYRGLPENLYSLDDALAHVGNCLDPVLGGVRESGQWDPRIGKWTQ